MEQAPAPITVWWELASQPPADLPGIACCVGTGPRPEGAAPDIVICERAGTAYYRFGTDGPIVALGHDDPARHWPITAPLLAQLVGAQSTIDHARSQLRDTTAEQVRLETQASVGELVRGLAHELNNPLAVILGKAELLARSKGLPAKAENRAQSIINEVEHCRAIIDRLRRLARHPDAEPQPVEIANLVPKAIERLRHRALPCSAVHLGRIDAIPAADPAAMIRSLEQVLDNATRAGAEHIWIEAASQGDQVVLSIANDGATPDEREIERACRPFFSGRQGEQPGLGLSLVASLLRPLRGLVRLEQRRSGPGAVTILTLPLWVGPARSDLDGAAADALAQEAADTAPRRGVLVADDNDLVNELLVGAVEERGLEAVPVATAEAARTVLATRPLHALLVDVQLGDGDGSRLVEEVLAREPRMRGRVALVTGDPHHPQVIATAQRSGCAVLGKPFRLEEVRALLDRLLDEGAALTPR